MDITGVVNEIISLGQENDWFIEFHFAQLSEHDYIDYKGDVITINAACFKAYIDPQKTITDDEFEDYLLEMIEVNIPESLDYTIMIKMSDSFI